MEEIRYFEDISFIDFPKKKAINKVFFLIGFFILLVSWFLLSEIINNKTFLPSPFAVVKVLVSYIITGKIFPHLWDSLLRIFVGFSLASLVAVGIGLLMSLSKIFNDICEPFIELFRPIPPYCYISVTLLWFGMGFTGKIFIIYIATFFPVLLNTILGVKEIDGKLLEAAQTLGAKKNFIVRKVILPSSLPSIMTGLRLGFGTAWLSLVAAEMVGASSGLGFLISDAREFVETDVVIMGMIIIGLIGYAFSVVFDKLSHLAFQHRRKLQN